MNILNTIREQFSPELLGHISKSVGESPEASRSALELSLPALLGSAAASASSPQGAMNLFNLIKEKTPQGGWTGSIGSWLGNLFGGTGESAGSSLVRSLLGSRLNVVRDFIANRSGVRSESASSLLGVGGQLLAGFLGKEVATRGLGSSGFGQLLQSQVPHLQGLLPPDLTNQLGLGNLFGTSRGTPPAMGEVAPDIERARPSVRAGTPSVGKVLAWSLIPLALLLGVLFMINRNREESMGGPTDQTWTARNADTAVSSNVQLPGINTDRLADQLKSAIARSDGSRVDLDGVSFDRSGTLSPAAMDAINRLGQMIKDNPSLKVTITTSGQSMDEAARRGNTIKSMLAAAGVARERIFVEPQIDGGPVPKVSFTK